MFSLQLVFIVWVKNIGNFSKKVSIKIRCREFFGFEAPHSDQVILHWDKDFENKMKLATVNSKCNPPKSNKFQELLDTQNLGGSVKYTNLLMSQISFGPQ